METRLKELVNQIRKKYQNKDSGMYRLTLGLNDKDKKYLEDVTKLFEETLKK